MSKNKPTKKTGELSPEQTEYVNNITAEFMPDINELVALRMERDTIVAKLNAKTPQKSGGTKYDRGTASDEYWELYLAGSIKPEGLKAAVESGKLIKPAVQTSADPDVETLKTLNQSIKIKVDNIYRVAMSAELKKSHGTGARSPAAAGGKNSKPAGFYQVTDEIKAAMKIRDIHKVGKDMIATYTTKDGKDHTSKIVNAAIAYHRENP